MKQLRLKDITLRRVKAAYKRARMKPARWNALAPKGTGCALEALAVAQGLPRTAWTRMLPESQVLLFAVGFDRPDQPRRTAAGRLGAKIAKDLGLD